MDPHQVSATAQTDAAKALVRAVVSAFYDDACVIVVDLLLRPPYFLRDGPGVGPRALHLPTKTVRKTLAFLQRECIVACETVRGVVETVSSTRTYRRQKAAQFWYIDLNRAVWSVTLRLHALRHQLEHDVVRLQTTSRYECPGYRTGACNGHYTELEIQDLPVCKGGQFLCHKCHDEHKNNPEPPPLSSYTLVEVDQSHELRAAETKLRRFRVQCQDRHDGFRQLRPSLFALLQKVHQTTRALRGQPVTSLLPSEHGAEEHVAPPSDQPAEPLVYADEAADERAGLLQVRGWNNQLILLDVESSFSSASTATAAYWARRGGVPFLTAPPQQGGEQKDKDNNSRKPPPIPERPSKAPCRQTTPFFLRDGFSQQFRQQQQQQGGAVASGGDGWDESLVVQVLQGGDGGDANDTANNTDAVVLSNVVQRTRGLSIEDDDNNDGGGGPNDMGGLFDTESTTHSFPLWVTRDGVGDNSGPPTNDNRDTQLPQQPAHSGNHNDDTAREIARAWRHGLGVEASAGEGNDQTLTAVARLGRSYSFPPRTSFLASESSYASVEWEG